MKFSVKEATDFLNREMRRLAEQYQEFSREYIYRSKLLDLTLGGLIKLKSEDGSVFMAELLTHTHRSETDGKADELDRLAVRCGQLLAALRR